MKQPFFDHPEIRLRACEPEDLETMYQIENDTTLWDVSYTTVPYSRYALRQYLEQSTNDIFADKQLRLMIADKNSKEVVGIVDLADFDPLHNRAAAGIVVQKAYRQRGIGQQALQQLLTYTFRFLHLHQLYAYIAIDNQACLHLFTQCGFTQSTLLKDWLKSDNGTYKDAYLLQCFNPENQLREGF